MPTKKPCDTQLGLVELKPRPIEKSVGRVFMPTKKPCGIQLDLVRLKPRPIEKSVGRAFMPTKKPCGIQLDLVRLKPRPTEKNVGRAFMPTKKAMQHPIRSCRAKATTYREKCRSCIYADKKPCGIQLGLVGLKPRPTEKSVGRAFMPTKSHAHPIRSCRAKAATYREKCRSCIYADKKPCGIQLGLVGLKPRPTEKSVGRAFMPTKSHTTPN